uniref:CBM21 domain-containing protein n=1 Tax=Romanomermis culicivorax TaxID=13658 RepID=A0A915J3W7_ROMCU
MDENDNYSSSSNPPKNQIYEPNLPPTGLSRSRKMSRADSENVLKELAAFVKDDDEDRLIKSFDDSTKLTVKVYDHDGNIVNHPRSPLGYSPVPDYRRTASLSLKSSLKKPGSPSRAKKKMVRFADSLNVDLKTRHKTSGSKIEQFYSSSRSEDLIKPHFLPLFKLMSVKTIDRIVMDKNPVCLESIAVRDRIIRGVIKVKNIAFEKSVIIRYTTDRWKSYTDFPAIYIQGTCDGFYDKFSFFLEFYNETTDFVELAIKYSVCNIDYWDNNDRRNYCFEYQDIVKSRTKLLFAWFDDAWLHFR